MIDNFCETKILTQSLETEIWQYKYPLIKGIYDDCKGAIFLLLFGLHMCWGAFCVNSLPKIHNNIITMINKKESSIKIAMYMLLFLLIL
jgi:hypothetical protein